MPKKHYKRGGGVFDNLGASLSNGWNSVSQSASSGLTSIKEGTANVWDKTKKATSSTYNSVTGTTPTTPSYTPPATVGGKSRKNKKGGYKDNISHNNLASSASPFSGKTAQPQTWVGGKTKRRRHRHSKSCRHKKHRKH
jgi:hypothetical protein